MLRLYTFELTKIFQKKAFPVTLVLGLLLIGALPFANNLFDVYEYPDGSRMSGGEFFKQESLRCGELSGRVIDDEFIEEVRGGIFDFALEKGYVTEEQLDDLRSGRYVDEYARMDYNYYQASPLVALDSAAEQLGIADAWYFLMDAVNDNAKLMTIGGEEFQELFRENIEIPDWSAGGDYADNGASGDSADWKTAYWQKEAAGIESPVVYRYSETMLPFLDSGFFIVWFLFILIAVSLSGAFADERSTRMDAMILSAKRGRAPVAIAKLLAGMTVSAAAAVAAYAVMALSCRFNHGRFYPDAVIQMLDPENAQNMTYGEAVMKQFLCTLLMAVLFAAVTVFLSQVMSATAVMGIQTGILMISFFNLPLNSEIIRNLWTLRPTHFLNAWIDNYSLFGTEAVHFTAMQTADAVYVVAAALLAAASVVLYRRYQVKSR